MVNGLVAVDDRLMGQLLLQFFTGRGHRFTDLFPTVLNAAQTQRYGKNLFKQFPHHAARHAAHYRQISDQRGQLRPELALRFPWQFRLCRLAAFRTDDTLALIFGDVGFDGRQLSHLMPSRLTLGGHLAR